MSSLRIVIGRGLLKWGSNKREGSTVCDKKTWRSDSDKSDKSDVLKLCEELGELFKLVGLCVKGGGGESDYSSLCSLCDKK